MITQTTLQKPASSLTDTRISQRVIVLIPDADFDLAHAAKKVWEIAAAVNGGVQFIGLCTAADREPGLRRQMVTLSALVENEKIPVQSRVEIGNDWLSALKNEWRQGDIVVCFGGISIGRSQKPLSQLLEASVDATIYVIEGLPHQAEQSRPGWMPSLLAWIGSITIILGLFWLQTQITHLSTEWARTLLLCISVLVEFGMIWFWNSLFS